MPEQTTKSIIVGAPVADVFAAWADFENFPRFMENIKSVTPTGDKTTRWVAKGPMGQDIEWDAETTRLEPSKRIAWRSTADSPITTSGQVTFNQLSPQQTEVTVTLQYVPPGGIAGEAAARLLSDPEEMLEKDLLRFKSYVETGVTANK
jgi:uncharacterized membrane protein